MDIEAYLKKQLKDSINQQFHIEGDIWLVPCVASYIQNEFKPLIRPLSYNYISDEKKNRQGWSSIEDEILLKIVISRGAKAWSAIAKELNAMVHDGNQLRQGRHCRERWHNHINPNLNKGKWTEEEDQFLITQQQILGNHWSEISKRMNGRTENSVKNRFKSLMRKKDSESNTNTLSEIDNDSKFTVENSPNIDNLLLMSPKLMNYGYNETLTSPNPDFYIPSPVFIRPITQKPTKTINDIKNRLKSEHFFEEIASPSILFGKY